MSYSSRTRLHAIALRNQGASLNEIVKKIHIAKSTASLWVSDIDLPNEIKINLTTKQLLGRQNAVQANIKKRKERLISLKEKSKKTINDITFTSELDKLLCALVWWCEGNKHLTYVRFTNSDPTLIANYLSTFRSGFSLDEKKFRVLVHVHDYHDDEAQKHYWSNITKIPLQQFHKSYLKMHSGKRKHKDYQGCVAISYYDSSIAQELEAIYNAFTSRGIG